MEIYSSLLRYKDVTIISISEDGTVYMVVWSGWNHKKTLKGMTGIGTYGYSDDGEYIGTTDKQLRRLKEVLTVEYDCGWYEVPDVFKNMSLSKGKRFNQGDMFFHNAIGTDKKCSEVGKADEPILSKALKSMKEE